MIFFRPVSKAFRITQNFGENPDRYPKTHGHTGIDYGAPMGSKVRASAGGQVVFAAMDPETIRHPKAGYGMNVRILHPNNVLTLYAHLSDPLVQQGQVVKVGEPIGISNNTGNSDGPHVHFEVRTGLTLTNAIDPAPFMTDSIPSESVLYSVEVTKDGDGLRAHKGPGLDQDVMKNFKTGDILQVLDEVQNKTWLRILDGFILNNSDFIQKVPGSEAETHGAGAVRPVEFHDEPVIFTVKITPEGNGLNVRSGPSKDSQVLFALISGQVVDVLEEVEGGAWLRIEDGFMMNNPQWVEKVGGSRGASDGGSASQMDAAPSGPALFSVQVTPLGNNLHLRSGPSMRSEILASFRSGEVLEVFEEVKNNTWLHVRNGFVINNPDWVERIDAPEDAPPVQPPAVAEEPVLFSIKVTPIGGGLRVRSGPSTDSDIIAGLLSGQIVEVFEEIIEDAWLRIRNGFIKDNPDWLARV